MKIRFWTLSLTFDQHYMPEEWILGISYADYGLHFLFFKWDMSFDWGYFISEFSLTKLPHTIEEIYDES